MYIAGEYVQLLIHVQWNTSWVCTSVCIDGFGLWKKYQYIYQLWCEIDNIKCKINSGYML